MQNLEVEIIQEAFAETAYKWISNLSVDDTQIWKSPKYSQPYYPT